MRDDALHALLLRFEAEFESPVFFFAYDPHFGTLRLREETGFLERSCGGLTEPIPFATLTELIGCPLEEASAALRENPEFRAWVMRKFSVAWFEAFPWSAPTGEAGKRVFGVFLVLHPRPSCLSSPHDDTIRAVLAGEFPPTPPSFFFPPL